MKIWQQYWLNNEALNQFYSNDLDISKAPAFLGCFKLPVPLAVGRL